MEMHNQYVSPFILLVGLKCNYHKTNAFRLITL